MPDPTNDIQPKPSIETKSEWLADIFTKVLSTHGTELMLARKKISNADMENIVSFLNANPNITALNITSSQF